MRNMRLILSNHRKNHIKAKLNNFILLNIDSPKYLNTIGLEFYWNVLSFPIWSFLLIVLCDNVTILWAVQERSYLAGEISLSDVFIDHGMGFLVIFGSFWCFGNEVKVQNCKFAIIELGYF